jgi:hypothetical protein
MKKYIVQYTDSGNITQVECDSILNQDGFVVFLCGDGCVVSMINAVYIRAILEGELYEQN